MRNFDNTSGVSKIWGLGHPDSLHECSFDTVHHSCLSGGVMISCVVFYCGADSGNLTLDTIGFSTDGILHSTAM